MASVVRPRLEKHYSDDWAKARAHEMLGRMLDDTLLTFKKPEDIRVLHFAGIDAQETQSVYLARGIPAQNITTLERDPQIARKIEGIGLGINVVNQDAVEFIDGMHARGEKLNFDVVSLDFTGTVSIRTLAMIATILQMSDTKHILLHSANVLKRDPNSVDAYRLAAEGLTFSTIPKNKLVRRTLTGQLPFAEGEVDSKELEIVRSFETGEGRSELKRSAYPHVIYNCFEPVFIEHARLVTQFLDRAHEPNLAELALKSSPDYDPVKHIAMLLKPFGDRAGNLSFYMFNAFVYAVRGSATFIPSQNSNYSYISESGSPMVGSIFFASKEERMYSACVDLARACGFPDGFRITDVRRVAKAFDEMIKQEKRVPKFTRDFFLAKETQVTFLGSSSKPVLTKAKFVEELEQGGTIDEVKKKYRGWSGKPLAQWKAHHTMGTYSDAEPKQEAEGPVVHEEDSDIEKITKEEAYDLLGSGIPTKEIAEAYPTSFTMGQLSAFQAWITMRAEKRE